MTNLKDATDKLNAFHLAAHAVAKAVQDREMIFEYDLDFPCERKLQEAITAYNHAALACGSAVFGGMANVFEKVKP